MSELPKAKQRAEAERKRQAEAARPKIAKAPAVAYEWFADDGRHAPREVKVEWANGSSCRFLPLMCGDASFWISRYPITKWSDFGVNEDGLLIAGLAMPHASGVCDLDDISYPHIMIAQPVK